MGLTERHTMIITCKIHFNDHFFILHSLLTGSCSFEEPFCEWRNMDGDDFDWIKASGQSDPDDITGPFVDHTLGTSQGNPNLATGVKGQ